MLTFALKPGKSFEIGDNIRIVVFSTHASHVVLGIDAPRDIAIHRTEVADRIRAEKAAREGWQLDLFLKEALPVGFAPPSPTLAVEEHDGDDEPFVPAVVIRRPEARTPVVVVRRRGAFSSDASPPPA